jgi:hypothetical protein
MCPRTFERLLRNERKRIRIAAEEATAATAAVPMLHAVPLGASFVAQGVASGLKRTLEAAFDSSEPAEPAVAASEHTTVVTASAVTACSKEGTRRRLGGAHYSLRKWLDKLREQWPPSSRTQASLQ